jgi:hypothetical protein
VSAEVVCAVLSLLVLAGAALALEAAWRAPRCLPCNVTSEALPIALIHTVPAVLEAVYRCPRCREIVSRRRFGEWD